MMPQYDGTLKFDTKIDEKGFNQGAKSIKSQAATLAAEYRRAGMNQSDAFKKAWSEIDRTHKKGASSMIKGIGNIGKAFQGLLISLGIITLLVKALQWLFRVGKEAIGIASDIQEVQNVVDTVFGDAAGVINAFSKTALKEFGLSELAVKQYASSFGAMGKAMGFGAQQNLEMSKTLTELTGDLASFYNKEQDLVQIALQSIYTGETQNNTLRQMGIILTENVLQQYAMSQGINKSMSAMSYAEKVNLRYNYVLQATNMAQGDFIKTQGSWANQTRILSQTWKELLGLIGSGLISALTPAIQLLNQLLSVLVAATQKFLAFWSALTGRQIQQTQSMASAAGGAADAYDDMGGAAGGAASQQEKLNDEMKETLAAFDDINVLAKDIPNVPSNGGGGGGSGGGSGGGGGTSEVATIFGDESTPEISPFWQKMLDLLEPFKEIDFTNLNTSVKGLYEALEPFGETLFDGFSIFVEDILQPLAEWTIEDYLPAYLDNLAAKLGVINPVLEIFNDLAEWFIDEYLSAISEPIGDGIIGLLEADTSGWQTLGDFLTNNKDGIVEIITTLVENAPSLLNLIRNLSEAYNSIKDGEKPTLLEAVLGKDHATTIENFKKAWQDAKKYFNQTIRNNLKSMFLSLAPILSQALTTVGNVIYQVLSDPFNSLVILAEFAINGIIKAINAMIDKINSINITIPEWVPKYGGNSIGGFDFEKFSEVSIPRVGVKIPKLATGAVIPPNSEFLAILGDQKSGTNIETPLDTMIQAFVTALDTRDDGNDYSVIEYNGLGDLAGLARELFGPLRQELKRRGINLRINA